MLPAGFFIQNYERITMIIKKFEQYRYEQFKADKTIKNTINPRQNSPISFVGKEELLRDIVKIAQESPKTAILEDSSAVKKIEIISGEKAYILLSREIENFKNIFSYKKQPSIIHELKISKNGKKFKTSKLNANEFALTFDKLREIVIPQVLKQVDASITSPADLLKTIGKGLINGNLQTGESLVEQGTNHYLQIGKIFQLPNESTVSLKHYFRNDIVEDAKSLPEINIFLDNSERNGFVVAKKEDRELFANTLELNKLITNKQTNSVKLETLKNEAQRITQELDNFQNNFETNTSETNKQIEAFKGTFII